ncbi:MAG: hypothetical protein WCK29_04785, partial [archaeon]
MVEDKKMVDAIDDGRIVRVSEEYAKREGLMILRKYEHPTADPAKTQEQMKLTPRLRGERKAYFDIERYRRPLRGGNEVRSTLLDNFHWIIGARRKQLNLSRKQVANAINVSEEDIKVIETGNVPGNDFIIINKLESFFKVNLRKDKSLSSNSFRSETSGEKRDISKPKWVGRVGVRDSAGAATGAEKI